MGGTLRDRCLAVLRPFLFAVLLTVAWLAWAAGTANAASVDPNPLGAIGQATVSLLPESGGSLAPALQDVPAQAAAVPFPVSGTAAAVVDVVDPVPGEATEVVTTVVNRAAPPLADTLTDSALTGTIVDAVGGTVDTVGGTVGTIVSAVDSLTPDLPGVQIPTLPVPAVPVPTLPLPAVPIPTVPTLPGPQIPLPQLPVQLPGVILPGRSPVTTLPPSGFDAVPAAPAGAGMKATARAASQAAQLMAAAPQQVRAVSPLEFLANTQALRALAATIGYVVSAAPAPANGPEPGQVFRFAALQNQSGSVSAGTGSAGAEASADVAAFWNLRHDARSGLVPDAALVPAMGPSFDPGSSPD